MSDGVEIGIESIMARSAVSLSLQPHPLTPITRAHCVQHYPRQLDPEELQLNIGLYGEECLPLIKFVPAAIAPVLDDTAVFGTSHDPVLGLQIEAL